MRSVETSPAAYARLAGFLYLLIIVCGVFSEAYIRASLVVAGDAGATVDNIRMSGGLFRLGFIADSIMLLSDVAIAILFYQMLKSVNRTLALGAAAFRLTQAAILGFNLLNYYAAMLLLSGSVYIANFEPQQLNALVMLFLEMHSHGYDLGLLFFSISTLLLATLLIRSDYFPALLGYGLIAAGLVYLAGSFIRFLAPQWVAGFAPVYIVPLVAELSFCLWLLARGVRQPQ